MYYEKEAHTYKEPKMEHRTRKQLQKKEQLMSKGAQLERKTYHLETDWSSVAF